MTKQDFDKIIENIILNVVVKVEENENDDWVWICDGEYINKKTWNANKLVILLYKIGFIGIKSTPSSKVQYFHVSQSNNFPILSNESKFYINPCYHSALDVKFYSKLKSDGSIYIAQVKPENTEIIKKNMSKVRKDFAT